ncbi:MAG: 3-deoxy-D-manno-octulosonic acid transferase [Blastocatellia bacterium]
MYFLYSLALSLLFLALLPYFAYQAIRHGKYAASFKERMGRLPESLENDGRRTVWVHAVSVGEFLAAKPLLERLRREMPESRIVVSTTTMTGQRLARGQRDAPYDAAFYFPFDWSFTVRRALARVKPSAVVILETELWPNFLRECERRQVITVVANGRISPRSFARYRLVGKFVARALDSLTLMLMQSEADAERALALGASADGVRVCGNLKYDINITTPEVGRTDLRAADSTNPSQSLAPLAQKLNDELDYQFGLSSSPNLIVAGSTTPGEEKILLGALREARREAGLENTRLVIAPRHPERFNEVAGLISQSGFSFARRSEAKGRGAGQAADSAGNDRRLRLHAGGMPGEVTEMRTADVILLDTIGELASLYRFAAVVFVGGSLVPRGGHNIIEPAVYSKPVIVGPYTENFREIVADFGRAEALVQVSAAGEHASNDFAREIIRLLADRELASAMGERGRSILLKSRGATDCVMAAIKSVMSDERKMGDK